MGSGRTQDQAAGGFGASDDSYGSRTGGGGYGDSTTQRGDNLSSGRTGGGLGMSCNALYFRWPNARRH